MQRTFLQSGLTWMVRWISVLLVLAFSLAFDFARVHAGAPAAAPVCGDGAAPDYGFSYALQQPHWTVGWQDYATPQAVTEVDTLFDQLNADSIAQVMILFQSPAEVGNRVNCAVHFLRYMQLGLAAGERKDNGFVFLIVVEPTRIDVHYGVGLGLPALTAPELTDLNRAAEEAYQTSHSLDQALLDLARGFDRVARGKYTPLASAAPTPGVDAPLTLSGPQGILALCGQLCLGLLLLLFLVWAARNGLLFSILAGLGRGGSFGGGRSGPTMRGGGGSGRSGRGN